ncbi:MAG: DUF2452 domain-containing protein [Bacteroidia bacterium]
MQKEDEFHNPIDGTKIAQNPGLLPYAHTLSSGVIKPADKGKIKSNALLAMEQQTDMQLRQLEEQIKLLYKQAKDIKERTDISLWIYEADMGFDPLIGHTYHLYEKSGGKHFLSMVAPSEWGRSGSSNIFVATVKMMADHTWEVLKRHDEG